MTAAYLTAKAAVLERIAAEREQGGWTPADTAAARARETADAAALLAAAAITALED